MDIYLSSPTDEVMDELVARCPGQKFNILLTRARMPVGMHSYFERYSSIVNKKALDCGAFSLNNSNLGLTESQLYAQYKEFARLNDGLFDLVFSYDPDFDAHGLMKNLLYYLELKKIGLNVVPVIHSMKSGLEARVYQSIGCDSIAIGKQEGKADPLVLFPQVFGLNDVNVKIHLFGITKFELITGCPVTSCDSKSWLDDAKTGVVRYWNEGKNEFNKTDVLYFPNKLEGHKDGTVRFDIYDDLCSFKRHIDRFGYKIQDLIGIHGQRNRAVLGMLYYKQIEDVVTDLHNANPLIL